MNNHYIMPWPDVQRRVFAYILDRLNLFSDFDPEKLEVSIWATSALRLQDVALDPVRLSNRGVNVRSAILREIRVQLSTNGVQVDASGLEVDAELCEPQPDLGLSMLLDPLDPDLSISDDQVGYGMGDTSGIVTKIADMALAQLTCNINKITINLTIRAQEVLVQAEAASLTSNKVLHIEALSVAPNEFYASTNLAESTYFDTQEQATPEFLRIDNLVAEVKDKYISLAVDNVCIEAIPYLELFLGLIDSFFLQQDNQTSDNTESSEETIFIGKAKVDKVTFLDGGHQFSLCQICYENGHLVIDELHVPGIAHCQPFLIVKPGLMIEIPLPIAAQVESMDYARSLIERLKLVLNGLKPPPAAEPTPFSVKLPDLRVAFGDFIIVIAPQNITHEKLAISQLSIVFPNGRAVVDGIEWVWTDVLHLNDLNVMLTSDYSVESSNHSDTGPPTFDELPVVRQNIVVDHFSVENATFQCVGSLASNNGKLKAELEGKFNKSWLRCSINATMGPWEINISETDGVIQLEDLALQVGSNSGDHSSTGVGGLKSRLKASINGSIILKHELATLRVPLEISGRYSKGRWAMHIPTIRVYLVDDSEIEIVKARQLVLTTNGGRVSRINVSACADSWERIHRLVDSLSPDSPKRHYNVQPSEINIMEDIDNLTFTDIPAEEDTPVSTVLGPELVVVEDYMDRSRHNTHKTDGWTMVIDHLSWQLFDGFDLKNTRNDLGTAIRRVETDPATTSPASPDEVVGDIMYESIFVGGRPHEDLQKRVREELGGKGFGRSMQPKVKLTAWGTSIAIQRSALRFQVAALKVADLLSSSSFQHVMEIQGPASALKIDAESVGENPELRLVFKSEPISVSLDQDMLEFLMRFFQFTALPPKNAPLVEAEKPYFQRVEIMDVLLRISYKPKKIDYRGLRTSYAELLNLFSIDRARVTLKHCVLYGILGVDRLSDKLGAVWGPEITHNQLLRVLTRVGPLRSVARLGYSVKDGAGVSTVKKTASGLYKVGSRLRQSRPRQ